MTGLNFDPLTVVLGGVLAGHVGDVAVESGPATGTFTAPVRLLLDTRAAVLTEEVLAQVRHGLRHIPTVSDHAHRGVRRNQNELY